MKSTVSSYTSDIDASRKNILSLQSQLDLSNKRIKQYQELVAAGAANRFDLEQAIATSQDLQSRISAAQAQKRRWKPNIIRLITVKMRLLQN
ncbi:TolC family protein [Sphingobacterium sp. E70]|nr:TolC family protein [Sphingobacterium sp. E70]